LYTRAKSVSTEENPEREPESNRPTTPLSPEKKAEVENLARVIHEAVDAEMGALAAKLATTDDAHLFGDKEFQIRGLAHKIAAKAIKGSPQNAINAVTYRETGAFFPMVWDQSARVPGEDVTDRYTRGMPVATARPHLMVEVRRAGQRVEAEVLTLDRETGVCRAIGSSLGPQADLNRHLSCEVTTGGSLLIVARHAEGAAIGTANVSGDTVVRLDIDRPAPEGTRAELVRIFGDRFGSVEAKRETARKLLAALPWDESLREIA
jgi:hypothetical protein